MAILVPLMENAPISQFQIIFGMKISDRGMPFWGFLKPSLSIYFKNTLAKNDVTLPFWLCNLHESVRKHVEADDVE